MDKIIAVLKDNPRGMTVTDVGKAVRMNRNSVAKYLEMLVMAGRVDMETFGPSKVYFISQRVPISAMLSVTSDAVVTLNDDLKILFANDSFLELAGREREDVVGHKISANTIPVLSRPEFITEIRKAMQGKELTMEIRIQKLRQDYFYNLKMIPTVFEDGGQGLTIIFEDITARKKAENELRKAKEELESRVAERTADLVQANEALQAEIKERVWREKLSDSLNVIAMTINSTFEFDEIMRRVVKVAAVSIKSDTAIIALKEGDSWAIRYTHGIAEILRGTVLSKEDVRMFSPIVEGQLPIFINDTIVDAPAYKTALSPSDMRSSLVIPLVQKSDVIGVMFLNFHQEPFLFGQAGIDFGKKLAAILSLALENARLFAEKSSTSGKP
jgi:PAS domain S-box-containing protein